MSRDRFVASLVTVVFLNVVQVITSNSDGSVHLVALDDTLQDTSTDGNVSGERTLLVNELSLDSLLGGLESETDISVESQTLSLLGDLANEDGGLLLECSLVLVSHDEL
eukprot:306473_1